MRCLTCPHHAVKVSESPQPLAGAAFYLRRKLSMAAALPPLAVYYEHPEWFRPLFAELDARGTPYVRVDAARQRFDPGAAGEPFALLFNRMSASAYLRGHGNAVFYTRHYLRHLERKGVRVVNGSRAFDYETSKALQLSLFAALGIEFPRTRVVNSP